MFKPSSVTKGKTIGVLDLGNSTVKCLFFEETKQGREIIAAGLEDYEVFGVYDGREFEQEVMKRAIAKVLERLKQKRTSQPEEFIIGLPANLLKARVVSLILKRKNPREEMTAAEETEIWQKVYLKAQKLLEKEFVKQTGVLGQELFFIAKRCLDFKIDGYRVAGLKGLTGERINFKILLTFLPKDYLQMVARLTESLKIKTRQISHEAEGVLEIMKTEENGLFLDMGGSFTQVFLVQKGIFTRATEFRLGSKDFTQALAERLGLSMPEADNFKKRYQQGLLSEPIRKRMKTIFAPLVEKWLGKLKGIIGEEAFFEEIFFWGGGAFERDVKEELEKNFETEIKTPGIDHFPLIKDKSQKMNHYQLLPLVFLMATGKN